MSKLTKVTEIHDPQGGRNRIREGDDVRVLAGPGNKQSFPARFLYAEANEEGTVIQVVVYGAATRKRAPSTRTFVPTRIKRVAQTRQGEKVTHVRGVNA